MTIKRFEQTIQIEGKVQGTSYSRKAVLCEECGQPIEDGIIEVVAPPNIDFHSKVLARFCTKCGLRIIEEYRQTGAWIIEK